jgi:hypothetical protein
MAKKKKGNASSVASRKMARIVVAEKKDNGHYSFRQRMVPLDSVQDELKAAKQ